MQDILKIDIKTVMVFISSIVISMINNLKTINLGNTDKLIHHKFICINSNIVFLASTKS